MAKLKTRSPIYLRQLSDDVHAKLEEKAKQLNVAKWVLIERILENTLGIESDDGIDVHKWLGMNHSKTRTGKPIRKERNK